MVFCHRRHAVVNIFKDRSSHQHKGWVRVLCSLPFALYIIKFLVGENLGFG